MRRGRVAVAGLLAFAVLRTALSGARPARGHLPAAAARAGLEARESYAALFRDLAAPDGLFRDGGGYAEAWPFSQALAASISLARLSGEARDRLEVERLLGLLPSYFDGRAYEPYARPSNASGAEFFDDNEWLALDLVDASHVLRRPAFLKPAEQVFAWIESGWDADGTDPCSGGVYWSADPAIRDRNTVSTANAAVLALELYGDTGRAAYLAWGRRMYGWVRSCLADTDGLLFDHIDAHGDVDTTKWAYNQGAMIAAGSLLYRATGQSRYLDEADALARSSLGYFARTRYAGQPAIFVAIYFRYLRYLGLVEHGPGFAAALTHYVATDERSAKPSGSELLDRSASILLSANLAAG